MELKIFQKGFNFSQDGPGNRLVYHLFGCNMHCPWCSNPEGMGCGGEYYTASPEQITEEAVSCKAMFFENGGVTFTGGECTLQADPLAETLKGLKNKHISTAVETNGTYKSFFKLIPLLDYIIMDFKHPDSDKHRKITGISNQIIKKNIMLASNSGKELLIRIPLINGFNTDEKTIEKFLEFFQTLNKDNTRIELLKYHEYGKDKWKKCGLEYTVKDGFVSEEIRINFENKIKDIGHKTVRT